MYLWEGFDAMVRISGWITDADQNLEVVFQEDLEIILEKLLPAEQSTLCPATMPGQMKKLEQKFG
jgi:superfamily II DNA/RNA helicase